LTNAAAAVQNTARNVRNQVRPLPRKNKHERDF
jgi:hypothetical protein